MAATFAWTAPTDGPVDADVESSVAVPANHDGAVDSYGVELIVSGLAVTPMDATAAVSVSNDVGESVGIDPPAYTRGEYGQAGAVSFAADDSAGGPAIPLADGRPLTYVVDLTLDGDACLGTGTWSLDLTQEENRFVPLD